MRMEKTHQYGFRTFKFSISKHIQFVLANLILESFFGKHVKGEKIDGEELYSFMIKLVNDVS